MPRVSSPGIPDVSDFLAYQISGVLDDLQALTVADAYDAVSG